jgi:hypothetical protein
MIGRELQRAIHELEPGVWITRTGKGPRDTMNGGRVEGRSDVEYRPSCRSNEFPGSESCSSLHEASPASQNFVHLVYAVLAFLSSIFPNEWNGVEPRSLDSILLRFSAELCTAHTARQGRKTLFFSGYGRPMEDARKRPFCYPQKRICSEQFVVQ